MFMENIGFKIINYREYKEITRKTLLSLGLKNKNSNNLKL